MFFSLLSHFIWNHEVTVFTENSAENSLADQSPLKWDKK